MSDTPVMDHVPEGWKVMEGTTVHPNGMRWICNGKSRFSKEFMRALVPKEVADEWRHRNPR